MNTSSIPAMNSSSKSRTERRIIRERCRDLVGKHRVPIRELISERFLVSIECTLGPAFFDRLSKIDKEDLVALDDLASRFTSLPTFRELINAATADWVIGKLKERGVRSHRNHVAVKASGPAETSRNEFTLPAGLSAITEKEFRDFFGPRRLISPTDLAGLIREGRAYEETLKPTGGHVVVIYIRTDEGDVHTLLVEGEHYFNRLRYFLPPRQAAQIYFFTLDVDPNNVDKAKATLAGPDKFRTTVRIADAVLRVEEDPTRIIDLIREFVDANVPGEGRELANAILDFIALIPPENVTFILEFVQFVLDFVGLFPGLGEPADLLNAAISAAREEYLDAVLSVASMLPFVGAVPGLGKALARLNLIITLVSDLPAGFRQILLDLLGGLQDELMSFAASKIPDIVRGMKRRIGEAADRMRFAAKNSKANPLPSSAGPSKSPTAKPAWEPEPIPVETPPKTPTPDADDAPSKPIEPPKDEPPSVDDGKTKGRKRKPETPAGPSGLKIVQRPDMQVRFEKAGDQEVPIYGSPHSNSGKPGHDAEIERLAIEMARSGEYEYIVMQRSWRTATGRVGTSTLQPDVIGIGLDGKAYPREVGSIHDTPKELLKRMNKGLATLPEDRRGTPKAIMTFAADAKPIHPKPAKRQKARSSRKKKTKKSGKTSRPEK